MPGGYESGSEKIKLDENTLESIEEFAYDIKSIEPGKSDEEIANEVMGETSADVGEPNSPKRLAYKAELLRLLSKMEI